MKAITQEWLDKAEGDCRVASREWENDDPVLDAVCFHAQQCIEKYLKAWLTERGISFLKIHDLETLARQCIPTLPELGNSMDDFAFLTSASVETRYPGLAMETGDAQKAIKMMQDLRTIFRHKFKL